MIRDHVFNAAWWGDRVGIISDPAFFALPPAQQQDILEPYAWVEFNTPLDSVPPLETIRRAGFFQADTQVNYRIMLHRLPEFSGLERLTVNFADEKPFTVEPCEMKIFEHERFRNLPGISAARLNERYARWGNQLAADQPAWCIQVCKDEALQGWFLARDVEEKGLNLTLAMLHREARISGLLLYQKALQAFAARGARVGWSSFSISNSAVHNIFASMGARFRTPTGNWLWIRQAE